MQEGQFKCLIFITKMQRRINRNCVCIYDFDEEERPPLLDPNFLIVNRGDRLALVLSARINVDELLAGAFTHGFALEEIVDFIVA